MTDSVPLRAYLPGVLIDWIADGRSGSYRALDGTLALADISGFTRLTERLARAGKIGAEEISGVLDTVFTPMLDVAYGYGADLIKWAGDALLLFFDGDEHAARACATVAALRRALRRIGPVHGTSASARLRLTAGVHSGQVMFFLAGTRHLELIVAGPAATMTARMQRADEAGEIAVSQATATQLNDPALTGDPAGPGLLLRAAPRLAPQPASRPRSDAGPGLERYLPAAIAEHLRGGPAEGEHRRVAVAFVQFSGADKLLAASGPERLSAALQQVIGTAQDAADANDVTFLETDICPAGGNMMLVAGAPLSAGRDDDRLLATLRAILDRPGDLTLRAGANAGRVFTGDLGPPYRRTYSVKGDAVNLAARLTARAAPGELLATAALLERSADPYRTSALPPFQVKGKSAEVHAFRVTGRREGGRSLPGADGALVGREAEFAALRDALDSLRSGRGSVAELTGEPGIGKSRLLGELLAVASGVHVAVIRCEPYGRGTPYAAAGTLLRGLLGETGESAPEAVAAALAAAVDSRAPELLRWLPLLATVVGAELPPTPEAAELDPAFRRVRLEQSVTDLLGALISGPALLAVEDVEFADDASASLLRRLAREVTERPWLIVVTGPARSAFGAPDDLDVLRLELGPLPGAAAQALLDAATEQEPLSPHQLAAISQRAAGNPLFLRELVRVAARGSDSGLLPESVEGVIAAEIDQLASADRSTLRAAAVVGSSFELGLLTGVLGRPLDDGTWARLGNFVLRQSDGVYRFRHMLVRDTAYEGLPFALRRQLHGRLAEAMQQRAGDAAHTEAAGLSLHFFHAQRYASAGYYARIAGERAAAAYANPEAAEFFARALEAAKGAGQPAEEAARLAEALGDIRYRLGEFGPAARSFADARAGVPGDPVAVARLCEKTALAVARNRGFSAALRWTARGLRALAGLAGRDADRQRALLLAARALLRYQQGRYAESAAASAEAAALAAGCGARDVLARALYLQDAADVAGGRHDGEWRADQALAICRELGNLSWEARVLNQLGMRAYFGGSWNAALGHYRQAAAAFERVGDQWNAAIVASNIGEILANQGRFAEAEQSLRHAERVLQASGALFDTAFVTSVLGRVAARSGNPQAGIRLLEAAREGYLKAGERNESAAAEVALAEALALAGRPAAALSAARDLAASGLARSGEPNASALGRVRGFALAALGVAEQAREALTESLEAARRRADAHDEALAADALIRLAGATGQPPDESLVASRDQLFARLGIVATPDLVTTPAGRPPAGAQ